MYLEEKNRHCRDKRLSFNEEKHIYTVDGDSNYTSVTTLIHKFFPHFDADEVIKKMKKGKNWGPDNQYYGMSNKAIKDKWSQSGKEASSLGTLMHLNIEYWYNNLPFTPKFESTLEYNLFQKYLSDHKDYVAYRTEWAVFSTKYKIAGSIDMIYHDPQDPEKFIIADWKRSKEIKWDNKWETGKPPIDHIPHCNYWHYTLQLNVYRLILEKYYGLKISQMFLVILHPDNKDYIKILVPFETDSILKMINALSTNA